MKKPKEIVPLPSISINEYNPPAGILMEKSGKLVPRPSMPRMSIDEYNQRILTQLHPAIRSVSALAIGNIYFRRFKAWPCRGKRGFAKAEVHLELQDDLGLPLFTTQNPVVPVSETLMKFLESVGERAKKEQASFGKCKITNVTDAGHLALVRDFPVKPTDWVLVDYKSSGPISGRGPIPVLRPDHPEFMEVIKNANELVELFLKSGRKSLSPGARSIGDKPIALPSHFPRLKP